MLQNGKPVKSIWLGGERFDKYSKDDEDALAKYKKMKALIGTKVYVRTTDNITDIDIKAGQYIQKIKNIKPQEDGYVSVIDIRWNGDHSVDLIGSVAVYYYIIRDTIEGWDLSYTDLCIIGHESI